MQFLFYQTAVFAAVITSGFCQSIDPNSVPISTRDAWCSSQTSQCPLICTQQNSGSAATLANDCDPTTLTYDCVCGNGLTPNASEYSQTIPYYICTQNNLNCQTNCGINNNACSAACIQDHPCGASDPTRVNASTVTTSSTSSIGGAVSTAAGGSVIYNGFSGATATTTASGSHKSGSGAARMIGFGEVYGLGMIAAGIFAGFTLLL